MRFASWSVVLMFTGCVAAGLAPGTASGNDVVLQ